MTDTKIHRTSNHGSRGLCSQNIIAFVLLTLIIAAATLATANAAEDRIPIFDAHLHYSRDAWVTTPPDAVFQKLDAAGVAWALVSSTPDDGTLTLLQHDPRRVVPELRPYHGNFHAGNWYNSPEIIGYLETKLKSGLYRGIGEFHLHTEADAQTPTMRRVAALAVANDIGLHVHSDAGPVTALFAQEPSLRILWAHAGMVEPAEIVASMLDQYENLVAEVSFRASEIAPGGQLDPLWRALLIRHADRFLIGSDTYIADRWDVYGTLIDEHRNWLNQLPRETATAIANGNAARLFKITQ